MMVSSVLLITPSTSAPSGARLTTAVNCSAATARGQLWSTLGDVGAGAEAGGVGGEGDGDVAGVVVGVADPLAQEVELAVERLLALGCGEGLEVLEGGDQPAGDGRDPRAGE